MDEEYFLSERVIHDQLLKEAERGVATLGDSFRTNFSIKAFAMFWPASVLDGDDGSRIGDAVLMELDKVPKTNRRQLLIKGLKRTNAYAVLLTEQKRDRVEVAFETMHGSRRWTLPIGTALGSPALGKPRVENDVEALGLLWSARKGSV